MTAHHVQYGDLGEWVFGLATIGALMWAILETRANRRAVDKAHDQTERSIDLERKRNAADTTAREVEQASLITMVITTIGDPGGIGIDAGNFSEVPVFDARWFHVTGERSHLRMDPSTTLLAGVQHSLRTTIETSSINKMLQFDRLVGLTFRDNAGRRWVKWADGRLEREATDLTDQIASAAAWQRTQPGHL